MSTSPEERPPDVGGQKLPVKRDVVLRTERLTRCFGAFTAVDHLGIEVQRGDVYGLLGPNGSGKTTTIRMILGLVHPTEGDVTVLGQAINDTALRHHALHNVGALVEQPAFYPFLNGRANLRGIATFACMPATEVTEERIEEVLEMVGLATSATLLYRKYSLGMRQRLGLAAALLNNPQLLIVDEPTNGLDPAGVVEIRTLLKQLAEQGITVMLSSHQLYEIQQVCSRVAIIKRGKLLVQGRVRDLLADRQRILFAFQETATLKQAERALRTRPEGALPWLQAIDYAEPEAGTWSPPGGWLLSIEAPIEHGAEINAYLGAHGLYATEIRRREASLERYFLELTSSYHQIPESSPARDDSIPHPRNPLRTLRTREEEQKDRDQG